jgi:hypothetical protein
VGKPDLGQEVASAWRTVVCVLGKRQLRDEVVGGLLIDVGDQVMPVAAKTRCRAGREVAAVDEELSTGRTVEAGERAEKR